MRLKFGEQKKLADWLGLSPSHFSQFLDGKKNISPGRAIDLEKKTGIPMREWFSLNRLSLMGKIKVSWEEKETKRG